MNGQISTQDEFWPFYVSQHLNPINRRLHAIGTTLGLFLGSMAVAERNPWIALAGVVAAYGFAWVGHFFYEKNSPATFTYPLRSLRADFRMYVLTVSGQMDTEILMLNNQLRELRREK